jgi:ABC-2 type transport system permease protein
MFLSSWSFLLLGVPLMLAIAANTTVAWTFYPLFLGHFVAFIAIPACVGVLAAWAVAMWAPHRPLGVAIGLGGVILLSVIYWFSRISQEASGSDQSLSKLMSQVSLARQPLLPSTWTAQGIVASVEQRVPDSLFYLGVVAINAIFLSWATVNLLAKTWPVAYSRAQQGRLQPVIRRGWVTWLICRVLFFYLPRRLREVMLKDFRAFARDARQWSQMLIMFGLLVLYVLNIRRLPLDISNPVMKRLFTFLNLTIVGLILATFTSRFIFPLLSLEGQQVWLLELLPIRRFSVLLVKFIFALTMTFLSAGAVMLLAMQSLELPWSWAAVHLCLCAGICIGLCGLAVGLGARFPVLTHRNPARIASSFGGTFNLIASMLFVGLEMTGVAYLSALNIATNLADIQVQASAPLLVSLLGFSVAVAAAALWVGGRHFERLEV